MEKYERKININRGLTTLDKDGDGTDDSIVLINKDDLFIPIILRQTFKDLGIYTDHEQEPEPINLSIVSQINDSVINNYNTDLGTLFVQNTENNYKCFSLSSGYQSLTNISTIYTYPYMVNQSIGWCKATHTSCGTSYAILNGCKPNGCPDNIETCCPGPINSHHLLTELECNSLDGVNCGGTGCICDSNDGSDGEQTIFGGIKTKLNGPNEDGNYRITWSFYCLPN